MQWVCLCPQRHLRFLGYAWISPAELEATFTPISQDPRICILPVSTVTAGPKVSKQINAQSITLPPPADLLPIRHPSIISLPSCPPLNYFQKITAYQEQATRPAVLEMLQPSCLSIAVAQILTLTCFSRTDFTIPVQELTLLSQSVLLTPLLDLIVLMM